MTGSPIKRMRRAQGKRLTAPAPEWATWSDTQKVIFCLQRSLDDVATLMLIPWEKASDTEKRLKVEVHKTYMQVGRALLGQNERDRGRDQVTKRLYDMMTGSSGDGEEEK